MREGGKEGERKEGRKEKQRGSKEVKWEERCREGVISELTSLMYIGKQKGKKRRKEREKKKQNHCRKKSTKKGK